MISLDNITYIHNIQEEIFGDGSPIVRKTVLFKEQDVLIVNGEFINRYGIFINRHSCELLNGIIFDPLHHYKFENEELYIERNIGVEPEDIDYDEENDFYTFKIDKFTIEGLEGEFWLIVDNYFWLQNDLPPE